MGVAPRSLGPPRVLGSRLHSWPLKSKESHKVQPIGLHVRGPNLTLAVHPPSSYPLYFETHISIMPNNLCVRETPPLRTASIFIIRGIGFFIILGSDLKSERFHQRFRAITIIPTLDTCSSLHNNEFEWITTPTYRSRLLKPECGLSRLLIRTHISSEPMCKGLPCFHADKPPQAKFTSPWIWTFFRPPWKRLRPLLPSRSPPTATSVPDPPAVAALTFNPTSWVSTLPPLLERSASLSQLEPRPPSNKWAALGLASPTPCLQPE